ncbi:MAG: DUF1189 family protein [Ardenticatenaceae bacterium]|nr:DUF1189 family protein [Ardenticatenaceae bacterium]MCB9446415.1 DUF1189 family protein [Ardenticatenaceae bacterium]
MEQDIKKLKDETLLPEDVLKENGRSKPAWWQIWGSGLVLSGCSPSFYYHAARRRLTAVLFFVLFGLILAGLQTGQVVYAMRPFRDDVNAAFDEGKVPAVTIANGEAVVHGPEPFVAVDDGRNLVVFDTTGQYTGEELGDYESGLVLTKTKLVSIDDNGNIQTTPLNLPFLRQRTIEINAEVAQRILSGLQVTVFLGLAFWRVILGLIYVTMLALVVWFVADQVKPGIGFGPVWTTGLYAAVPAAYAHYLLDRVDIDFFSMFTLLLLAGWVVSLVAAAADRQAGDFLRGQRPLRAWRALIGLPMLVVLALDVIYQWEKGAAIVWLTAVITFLILFALELLAAQSGAVESRKIAPQE